MAAGGSAGCRPRTAPRLTSGVAMVVNETSPPVALQAQRVVGCRTPQPGPLNTWAVLFLRGQGEVPRGSRVQQGLSGLRRVRRCYRKDCE